MQVAPDSGRGVKVAWYSGKAPGRPATRGSPETPSRSLRGRPVSARFASAPLLCHRRFPQPAPPPPPGRHEIYYSMTTNIKHINRINSNK